MNLIKELEVYKDLLNDSDIVSITDSNGVITYANDRFCIVSGYSREELIGKNHNIVRHPNESKEFFKHLWKTIRAKKVFKGIIRNISKNGETYYVDSTIHPILGENGQIESFIAIRHEITHLVDKMIILKKDIANYKNPVLFLFNTEPALSIPEFCESEAAIEMHSAIFSEILTCFSSIKEMNAVQIEKNKLAVVCESKYINNIDEFEVSLFTVLNNIMEREYIYDGIVLDFFIEHFYSVNRDTLLQDVLRASVVKTSTRNVSGFSDKIKQQNISTKNIIKEVQSAIDKGNVFCYFQPIFNNKTSRIEKVEALVRMKSKDEKIIPPIVFLEAIKDAVTYFEMTKKILADSICFSSVNKIPVSVNISLNDLKHQKIRDIIIESIEKKPDYAEIIIEILEDQDVLPNNDIAIFLEDLKASKVKIAIDDFGIGYSNYERVMKINPDIIKIDGSLIKNILVDDMAKSIVEVICLFCKKHNIKTVAEYVENEDILTCIKNLGIDYSQGYFISKPLSCKEACDLMAG